MPLCINMMNHTKLILGNDDLNRAVHKMCASHVDNHVDEVAITLCGAIPGRLLND
jgi:hypothetical protein